MEWLEYLDKISGGMKGGQLAEEIGVRPSSHSKWKKGQIPDPGTVIAAARRFGRSPIEALQIVGFITEDEANLKVEPGLSHFSESALLEELTKRTNEREHAKAQEKKIERMHRYLG